MNNSNKAVRVSGISYGTGCEIPKEGTWVLNKGERVVGDNRDLKKYLLQNSNTGESKMQNDISKDLDNLILKYGFIAVKNYFKSKDKSEKIIGKFVKVKDCPMPSYVGDFNLRLDGDLIPQMVCDPFIGSDVTLEIADGSKIIIPYKEQYNENSTFKEYRDRSIAHAYEVLKKALML